MWLLFGLAVFIGGMAPQPTAAQTERPPVPEDLAAWIEAGMAAWDIPGMSVSIVRDDEVIFAQGFGIRKLGETEAVDEHTIFGVASTTKAFTAAALGLLVDEGRLGWDDPVTRHLPGFELYDPYVTRAITIRDLLTHRSGLGRMTGNRLQYMPFRDQSELLYRMRYMQPERPFREGYVYSNMMYMVAGEVIRAVTGTGWDEFVQQRFFEPLGMDRSSTSITQIGDWENAAWPHQLIEGELRTIPRRNFDNVGASASVNTSAADMAQWMRLHLGEAGVFEGQRLISPETARELYRIVTPIPGGNREAPITAYALGWTVSSWNGRTIYRHGGATDGMNTTLILIPEENTGIFITTNTFNTFMNALGRKLKDYYTGAEFRDWHEVYLRGYEQQFERVMALRQEIHDTRIPGTQPSRELSAYTGLFHDPLYDDVRVVQGEAGLELHFWGDPTQIADLEHWHHDTFRAVWRNPAQREKFVWFQTDRDGVPAKLHVQFSLRPMLLQAGAYPTNYYRIVEYRRAE